MSYRFTLVCVAGLMLLGGCARHGAACGSHIAKSPQAAELLGRWKVDLRPVPGADDYFQQFVVDSVKGEHFSGTFYGTPLTEGRINTAWGKVRLAFVTADQSGAYHHSGVLTGDGIEGLSNSTGRDFLAYWSAKREVPAEAGQGK